MDLVLAVGLKDTFFLKFALEQNETFLPSYWL